MGKTIHRLYIPLLLSALALHVAIVWIARNSVMTPWEGGGDMLAYILLARNLVTGAGYTYAHVPSAWRTPGYPLVIAAAMELFGTHFAIAVRCLQVSLSVVAAYFCMRAARIFFGETAAKISLLAALFLPTLAYFSGEILSESLTAFFMALFLWIFAEDSANSRWTTAAGMGLAIGAGAMFRPNLAAVAALALTGSWPSRRTYRARLQLALIPLCAVLVFAPWIFRNYEVFGRLVLSTKSGTDALCGVLNPASRFNATAEGRMRALIGSILPNDLETNSPSRLALGSEIELNRKCWQATRQVWREMSWGALGRWALGKWASYWLSLDQLLEPGHISRINRLLHVVAVVFYWVLLAAACIGWWNLRGARPQLAVMLLGYAVLMTLVHTPFVMDSRIRAPLIDPLIAVLAGGGVFTHRRSPGFDGSSAI
jgi:4-amino-4-deoxy-L-arabinose transferase-like glycosyltransferase